MVAKAIRVEIDDREVLSMVPEELQSLGVEVTIRRLLLGDYLIDGTLLVERKTLRDLVASIIDGRVFSQVRRLVASRRPAVLLLEGTAADLAGCGSSWESIQGAMVTIALVFGLPILRTRSAAETARTMVFIARQQRAIADGALHRYGLRPKGKAAMQSYILQGLPGVGTDRAARLLGHFGTVESVASASLEALMEVPGIGPTTAKRIRWAVGESKDEWRVRAARNLKGQRTIVDCISRQ